MLAWGGYIQTGILIDAVSEVLAIRGEDIEDAPAFGEGIDTNFILGMAKSEGDVKILLNIEVVLTAEDLTVIEDAESWTGSASKMETVN